MLNRKLFTNYKTIKIDSMYSNPVGSICGMIGARLIIEDMLKNYKISGEYTNGRWSFIGANLLSLTYFCYASCIFGVDLTIKELVEGTLACGLI